MLHYSINYYSGAFKVETWSSSDRWNIQMGEHWSYKKEWKEASQALNKWANKQDPFRLDQAFSRRKDGVKWEGHGRIPHTDPSYIEKFIGEVRQAMVQGCRVAEALQPKI